MEDQVSYYSRRLRFPVNSFVAVTFWSVGTYAILLLVTYVSVCMSVSRSFLRDYWARYVRVFANAICLSVIIIIIIIIIINQTFIMRLLLSKIRT